jgi:hypothetical protein
MSSCSVCLWAIAHARACARACMCACALGEGGLKEHKRHDGP